MSRLLGNKLVHWSLMADWKVKYYLHKLVKIKSLYLGMSKKLKNLRNLALLWGQARFQEDHEFDLHVRKNTE